MNRIIIILFLCVFIAFSTKMIFGQDTVNNNILKTSPESSETASEEVAPAESAMDPTAEPTLSEEEMYEQMEKESSSEIESQPEDTPVETVQEEKSANEQDTEIITPGKRPPEETTPPVSVPEENIPVEPVQEETIPSDTISKETVADKKLTEPDSTESLFTGSDSKKRKIYRFNFYAGSSLFNYGKYDMNVEGSFDLYPLENYNNTYGISNAYILSGYTLGTEFHYNRFKFFSLGAGLSFSYLQELSKYTKSDLYEPENLNDFLNYRMFSMWSAFVPAYLLCKAYYEDNVYPTPYVIAHLGYNMYFREEQLHFTQIKDDRYRNSANTSISHSESGGLYYAIGLGCMLASDLRIELLFCENYGSFKGVYTSTDSNGMNYTVKYSSDVKYTRLIALVGYNFSMPWF